MTICLRGVALSLILADSMLTYMEHLCAIIFSNYQGITCINNIQFGMVLYAHKSITELYKNDENRNK